MSWFNFDKFYDYVTSEQHIHFKSYVELGVWKGESIAYLAKRLQNRKDEVSIFGVDLFENWDSKNTEVLDIIPNIYNIYNETLNNNNVRDMIIDIKSLSWEAANQFEDNSVDFVFVDADHTYESVNKDIKAWYPKVKVGGMIAGHDAHASFVTKAVKDNLAEVQIRWDWGAVWFHEKKENL